MSKAPCIVYKIQENSGRNVKLRRDPAAVFHYNFIEYEERNTWQKESGSGKEGIFPNGIFTNANIMLVITKRCVIMNL